MLRYLLIAVCLTLASAGRAEDWSAWQRAYTPVGHNERLLEQIGFTVREVQDVTDAVVSVSQKWRDARARGRDRLVALEGVEAFDGLQRFQEAVYVLAKERRLSRYMDLAER